MFDLDLSMFDQIISTVGSAFLLVRMIPQVIKCVKQGHGKGLSIWFLWAWLIGEGLILTHFVIKSDGIGLVINYSFMICCILTVMFYKFFPRREK